MKKEGSIQRNKVIFSAPRLKRAGKLLQSQGSKGLSRYLSVIVPKVKCKVSCKVK